MNRIMIVDDEPTLRELLQEYLTMIGYETTTAANGAEALSLIDAFTPDLVLLDLNMPIMDGFSFLGELSRRGAMCRVIIMSSHTDLFSKNAALRLGASDYLTKPFYLFQLDGIFEEMKREERRKSQN
ncbi:MAG: response regulator [Deltaproteobacteria bacterium]|nr:response regulator [Deltaproteobacteria bacterium]